MHGHGLNDGVGGDNGNGLNATPSRAAPRGRKSESARPNATPPPGAGNGVGGHERSSSVGRSGRSTMAPAAAAAAAAVAAAAAGSMTQGMGGLGGGGHVRSGSGPVLMGQRGDGMPMDSDWTGGHDRLPSLDLVTGGLRKLHGGRHGNSGGQGGGPEVRWSVFL